jgi:hypothetical protein
MPLTRRQAARALGTIRLINGSAALLAPRFMARTLQVDPDEHPQMIYFMKMFGIRTVLLGLHLLSAEGEDLERAMRTGVVIHASDTMAAAVAGVKGQLPTRAALTGTLTSAVNTFLALYGSGLIGREGATAPATFRE